MKYFACFLVVVIFVTSILYLECPRIPKIKLDCYPCTAISMQPVIKKDPFLESIICHLLHEGKAEGRDYSVLFFESDPFFHVSPSFEFKITGIRLSGYAFLKRGNSFSTIHIKYDKDDTILLIPKAKRNDRVFMIMRANGNVKQMKFSIQ